MDDRVTMESFRSRLQCDPEIIEIASILLVASSSLFEIKNVHKYKVIRIAEPGGLRG